MLLTRRAIPHLARSLRRTVSTALPDSKNPAVPVQKKQDQAPNYPTTWSTNQRPRPGPASSPRFEQTDMNLQPNPLSAMELIANEPIRIVNGRKAVCDGGAYSSAFITSSLLTVSPLHCLKPFCCGSIFAFLYTHIISHNGLAKTNAYSIGGGPLGHPKIYINLVSAQKILFLALFYSYW